jgi:mono/diheme cytochrome c family protein
VAAADPPHNNGAPPGRPQTDPGRANLKKTSSLEKAMKRIMLRVGVGLVVLLLVAGGSLGAAVSLRWDRVHDVPEVELRATTNPELIERGRYLAYGPAHCAFCHNSPENQDALLAGEEPPMVGGYTIKLPFADLTVPNLTPDAETGIGRYTDGQIARMMRHNVKPNGQVAVPIMEFENMSDEDIIAVLSFLRAQPPVRNEVPERRMTPLGKTLTAFLFKPTGPTGTPPRTAPAEAPTVERGEYVATAVAGCAACHTKRNLRDGSYMVPKFAGGFEMESETDRNRIFMTPNLTPAANTGHIVSWSEDRFVARFRTAQGPEGTPMPWIAYARMSDDDIRAVYRFLQVLEPYEHDTGPMQRARN